MSRIIIECHSLLCIHYCCLLGLPHSDRRRSRSGSQSPLLSISTINNDVSDDDSNPSPRGRRDSDSASTSTHSFTQPTTNNTHNDNEPIQHDSQSSPSTTHT